MEITNLARDRLGGSANQNSVWRFVGVVRTDGGHTEIQQRAISQFGRDSPKHPSRASRGN